MKNKTLCIALSLFLALSMTACAAGQNASEGESKAPSPTSSSVTSADATDTSRTATEASADTDEGIVPRITGEEYYTPYNTRDTEGLAYTADSFAMADGAKKSLGTAAEAPAGEAYADGAVNTAPAEPLATAEAPALTTDDGMMIPLPDEPVSDIADWSTDPIEISDPVMPEIQPQAGLLTAGEWNDNSNWGFFTNLVNSGTIQFPSYGLDPRFRYQAQVKTPDGTAVVNAKVTLYDENNQPVWTTVTDKEGNAYLFAAKENGGVWFTVESDGKKQEYSFETDSVVEMPSNTNEQQVPRYTTVQSMTVTFDGAGQKYQKTDIMFIMDATGSMSDEMLFLQTEFTAISEAVGDENTRYSVNFYRDKGDEYITKCYDFTQDIVGLQQKLNSESADGGGDTPEAIAEILEETIAKSNWNEDSVKLAFLVFDAPPHEGTEQSLLQSIQLAAEKGIHLIPVVSSGSERDTELFGRAAAIMTNGTYVFLTDDSGIGNSHMEPIIGSYQVEKLYDLVVRVINSYKQ